MVVFLVMLLLMMMIMVFMMTLVVVSMVAMAAMAMMSMVSVVVVGGLKIRRLFGAIDIHWFLSSFLVGRRLYLLDQPHACREREDGELGYWEFHPLDLICPVYMIWRRKIIIWLTDDPYDDRERESGWE